MGKLLPNYRCPSCWVEFRPEEVHWIATSPDLGDDPQLEPTNIDKSKLLRFLPRHFTPDGKAVDKNGKGRPCNGLACPYCHLEFPRSYLESRSFMTSIVGGQGTGKSYFLVSLVWWMKRNLSSFGIEFKDTFAELNGDLDVLIENLFPNRTANDKLYQIPFNPAASNSVLVFLPENKMNFEEDRQLDSFPSQIIRPFMYAFNRRSDAALFSLCLYDHAGEDYTSGANEGQKHLTKHLGYHDALFFLFDPTQNLKFIEAYKRNETDKELFGAEMNLKKSVDFTTANDPVKIFNEMSHRIREEYIKEDGTRLFGAEKYDHPVVIVVPKCDAWKSLLDEPDQEMLTEDPILNEEGKRFLDQMKVRKISNAVKRLLLDYVPTFVNAVDAFASDVVYIPVSATGQKGEKIDDDKVGYRPGTLKPVWIGIPLLYALAKHKEKLIDMSQNR